jgi:cohesin complex subunit SA-1/2
LQEIQEAFQKESAADYPIVSRNQKFRHFRGGLIDFFTSLIEQISASGALTKQPAMIESIEVWATAMSSSTLRPFRHTATTINLCILTALCGTMSDLERNVNNSTKLLEAEKSKSRKNAGRIKSLEQDIAQLQEVQSFLEDHISDIYES